MQTISRNIKHQVISWVFFVIATCCACIAAVAQDSTTLAPSKMPSVSPHSEGKYCVMLQDGKVVVMMNDKLIDHDVVFKDGSKLTPSGDYIKKGKTTVLKNGDCVDKNGELTIHTRYTPPKIVGLETCTN